jgi:hypothetical protein
MDLIGRLFKMGFTLKAPSVGSVTINPVDTASDLSVNIPAANGVLLAADSTTGGMFLPIGTTAKRPASPVAGQMRFNITTGSIETYNGSAWI